MLSRLLIVLVVCLVTMALPAAPAQANGTVITLSPSSGVPGTNVTVRGYNFTADEWVDIYYCLNTTCLTAARIWRADDETDEDGYFQVTFEIPESYTGAHEVRVYIDNSLQATGNFTVKPGLTVSPEKGPVGTNVAVKGHGFAKDEEGIEVYFDGEMKAANIRADATGNWTTSFQIPPSAKGDHRIDAKGETNTLNAVKDATFEVTPGISIDKSSGIVGENITMIGSGFYANDRYITILFAGEEVGTETRVDADAEGYWKKSFEVPEMPIDTYSVTAEGELTPKEDITARSFEINPGLVLSPDEGHVGIDLTATGGGFAANKAVNIMYEGSQKATATTNDKGSFEASFVLPESQHGGRQVTAGDAAGNNATAIFTMESDPPDTPELISPPDESRVGFIGKVRPKFEWSAVSDDSGVRYRLQIATSANVTATGEFVHPIVSIPDIVGTNYTLNATEALPYGTYYWIVRAVDGAANAGNWTAVRSFRAGVLPLWAFILIIVAIVVLIGAAVYFFIIRRRIHYY
ncbi:MAG: IPT/TIG domain-containing protein [Dehalococcoidia bacterium]|nr:IPT/TIG domain-containing protein [Dehalococcoidia bacterium]